MQNMDLLQLAENLGKLFALLGSVVGTGWWCMKKLLEYKNRAVGFFSRLERVMIVVERELTPNGGSSMSDRVKKIDTKVESIGVQVNDLDLRSRRTLAKQSAIVQALQDPRFETCEDGEITTVSRELERLTGLGIMELLGHGWFNAVHQEDRQAFIAEWKQAVEQGRAFIEQCRMLVNGRFEDVYVRAYPTADPIDKTAPPIGWLGFVEYQKRRREDEYAANQR